MNEGDRVVVVDGRPGIWTVEAVLWGETIIIACGEEYVLTCMRMVRPAV